MISWIKGHLIRISVLFRLYGQMEFPELHAGEYEITRRMKNGRFTKAGE